MKRCCPEDTDASTDASDAKGVEPLLTQLHGICCVFNRGYMKGRPHCLDQFALPVPPVISREDRATIIMEQIFQPNPDKISLSERERSELTRICTKYPMLWSIHPLEVRPANNTPAVIQLQEGAKMTNQRPYDLSYYETAL